MSRFPVKRTMAIRHARPPVLALISLGALSAAAISGSLARARLAPASLARYQGRLSSRQASRKAAGPGARHVLERDPAGAPGHLPAATAATAPERRYRGYRSASIDGLAAAPATRRDSTRWSSWGQVNDSVSAWPTTSPTARRVAGPSRGTSPGRPQLRTAALPGT